MAAPQVTITANPNPVNAGSTSTLTVSASNANQVTITGTDGSNYSLPGTGGTQAVTPKADTTYTAIASGPGGSTSASVAVKVNAVESAPTVSITANPNPVNAGSAATLTVTATNATQVTVTGTDGSKYSLAPSGGTQAVTPTADTTYTAVAMGPGGSTSASVAVKVNPAQSAPTVSITANPNPVNAGSAATLTVTATNATQVTVTGTDGSKYSLAPSGGTQSVSPTQDTTYTAVATGAGGTASANVTLTVTATGPAPTVTISADPSTVTKGSSSTLTVSATNATQVTITDPAGDTYDLPPSGGTKQVAPGATTTYTATATGNGGDATAKATVTVIPAGSIDSIDHVVFMLQENHAFDNYFGMLNPYRKKNGWNIGDDGKEYDVDGIDDKLSTTNTDDNVYNTGTHIYSLFKFTSTCVDDMSSDWLASYGDVNRYNFLTNRPINMDGFVHNAAGYANSCSAAGACAGTFTDLTGQRAMGYYDQDFLNYYYYMASQFALSDRWFSPVSSKSVPNRIATFSGGTTQGLVKDPGSNDHLPQLGMETIFQELDQAGVSWKIYYTVTDGFCLDESNCPTSGDSRYPATTFSTFSYSSKYLYNNPTGAPCASPTQPSSVVGDSTNSFCIDPSHIAPLSQYFTDLTNGALPSFAFIESGSGINDEHPGSGQSILVGQAEVAKIVNALMNSQEWMSSVFFFSYDEGGGPYDHVPPVPGQSNDNTDASVVSQYPDISSIAINPDAYKACLPSGGTPTTHCDLASADPGANSGDAAARQGFAAQLGFRVPNIVISPFARRHYVSHIPMDHTAVIKFVEDRFIGPSAHLTARDAAQPNLLDFFDFTNVPWSTPPVPPAPATDQSIGHSTCTPSSFAPQSVRRPALNLFQY
jgi:phospholipase C